MLPMKLQIFVCKGFWSTKRLVAGVWCGLWFLIVVCCQDSRKMWDKWLSHVCCLRFCHIALNEKKMFSRLFPKRPQNLIKKGVKLTHSGIKGREEIRWSVNEKEGVRQTERERESERGSVLDGLMTSHMLEKQIEIRLWDVLSPNCVVTFTQQGNTPHT